MCGARLLLGTFAILLLAVAGCGGGDPQLPADQQGLGEEIKGLKGTYFVDKKAPEQGMFSVNLSGTAAEDALVAKLEKLPNLKHLKLNATKVTNASVNSFKKMKSLVTLDIGNTKITEEGVKSLQAASPNLEITWNVPSEPGAEPGAVKPPVE